MFSNKRFSVSIVDDDAGFVHLLREILENDEDNWEVIKTYSSIEDFSADLPPDIEQARAALPDLLIIDLFASSSTQVNSSTITGAHIAMALRGLGLNFGSMIVSSLDSPSLLGTLRLEHPLGWSYIVKSTSLTPDQILQGAREALLS
jgi:DNA-binding NarL/FixJ family response regulator